MNVQLHLGDCLEVLAGLPENSVDTCITDPPYELGFMGKKWDSSGIAFQPETWQAVFRVLKPGAILLAFGGTRTYHRMVCAIEDAGFEIRDTIAWVYGSGFPKSYDIGKGIDKQAGAEREVIGKYQSPENTSGGKGRKFCFGGQPLDGLPNVTKGNSGWDGWGTALKPAFEPIVVAMKPVDGNFVNNALTWGVAGLWIDGGRVGTVKNVPASPSDKGTLQCKGLGGGWDRSGMNPNIGRFPANLIHDGSDEVVETFDRQTPNRTRKPSGTGGSDYEGSIWGNGKPFQSSKDYQDNGGSAARFFYCAKASRSERNAGLEGMEEKVGGGMKGTEDQTLLTGSGNIRNNKMQNHHPTVKPIELMRYLVRLTKTPTGGVVLDPFTGSGTTGIACVLEGREFVGIEREAEYVEIAEKRIAEAQLQLRLPLEAEIERLTVHSDIERQDDKLPEREVCEACGGDGSILLRDNYKGQATATVDCPYCNCTGYVKECE
jgi:DNA modification methylase